MIAPILKSGVFCSMESTIFFPVINAIGGTIGKMYGINFEFENEKKAKIPKIQQVRKTFSDSNFANFLNMFFMATIANPVQGRMPATNMGIKNQAG